MLPSQTQERSLQLKGMKLYSDNETRTHAKRTAMALAQEQAVRNHRVFVDQVLLSENLQLEDDLIHAVSVGTDSCRERGREGTRHCITVCCI